MRWHRYTEHKSSMSANVAFSLFNVIDCVCVWVFLTDERQTWQIVVQTVCLINISFFCSLYFLLLSKRRSRHNKINLKFFYFVNSTATRSFQSRCRSIWCTKSVAHVSLFWLHCASCIRNADIHSFGKHTDTHANTHLCLYIFVSTHSNSFVNPADC